VVVVAIASVGCSVVVMPVALSCCLAEVLGRNGHCRLRAVVAGRSMAEEMQALGDAAPEREARAEAHVMTGIAADNHAIWMERSSVLAVGT
jgi:hypothetical protein